MPNASPSMLRNAAMIGATISTIGRGTLSEQLNTSLTVESLDEAKTRLLGMKHRTADPAKKEKLTSALLLIASARRLTEEAL